MATEPFELDLTDAAHPQLRVGDADLSDLVRRVMVEHVFDGGAPRVYVEFITPAVVTGQGWPVQLRDLDQREAVLEFLQAVDPAELEKAMLEGDFSDSPAAVALGSLKEMAGGTA